MKALGLFMVGLLAFAAIVIGGVVLFLNAINEERKNTCGKCDFYDESLHHCWARGIYAGTDDKACVTFDKKEK